MKPGIHPDYHKIKVSCACGASYEIGSTRQSFRVDICAACHPFFTGKQKFVDSGGRVERFLKKYERAMKKEPAPQAVETVAVGAEAVAEAVAEAAE